MKLYELQETYNAAMELDLPEEELKNVLDIIQDDINKKLGNIGLLYKNLLAEADVIKQEEKRLADKRKALENRANSLKQYAQEYMLEHDTKKIKEPLITLRIQKNAPSLDVSEEADIPDEYYIEQEPKLDRETLLKDIKDGKKVKGCSLKQTESIRIV